MDDTQRLTQRLTDKYTERFVEVLSLATRQAGAVARYLQGKVLVESKPDEPTPEGQALTAVDLSTQDLILNALLVHWPDVAVDAEEDTALARRFSPRMDEQPLIVLDPVDGTYNYTQGSPDYAVMAGLIVRNRYRAAVIHYPTRDELYWATENDGCFLERGDEPARRVVVSEFEKPQAQVGRILVSAHVSKAHQAALSPLARDVSRCRCSAYDGACLALLASQGEAERAGAEGSVAENRADRRRCIALYLSLAAGGVVRMGRTRWRGEDPESIDSSQHPTICALDESLADDMESAWKSVSE